MDWVKELFDDCSEIILLRRLSDAEKIGYLLAVSQEHPSVPSHLPIEDKVDAIREYYHDNYTETGA